MSDIVERLRDIAMRVGELEVIDGEDAETCEEGAATIEALRAQLATTARYDARIAELDAENARLREALGRSSVALDDWLAVYASEHMNAERVREAKARIRVNGGTLAYIATVQMTNREAQKETK